MLTRATSVHVRYSCLNKTRRFSSSNRKVLTEACLTCTDPRFSVLEYGDVVIGTIPAGARNIVIKEATASKNNLCKYQRMSKNFRSCFKVLEYGIHYRATSKTPRP